MPTEYFNKLLEKVAPTETLNTGKEEDLEISAPIKPPNIKIVHKLHKNTSIHISNTKNIYRHLSFD